MGLFSALPKLRPTAVFKAPVTIPRQLPNRGLQRLPAPPHIKTKPPSAVEALGNSSAGRAALGAKTSAVGLMVGGGAALLLGGSQLRSAVAGLTGLDLPMLEGPGQLLSGAVDGVQGLLAAVAGVAITVGAAYVTWSALADSPLVSRVAATGAASAAVGLAAAVALETLD
jgi:hypothetical protein